ncbi:hypothetical protein D9M68_719360 [compost metagenome]
MPIAPGLTSAPALEINICIISVPPMPSVISMPVAAFQLCRVASGSASPADTLCRRLEISKRGASAAICR